MTGHYKILKNIKGENCRIGNGGKHGLFGTPIYLAWKRMKDRCLRHDHYIKNGIMFCEEWSIFSNFYKDMSPDYADGLSLDRVNNSLGYFKENCRWVTNKQQQQNKKNVRFYEYNGEKKTLGDWSVVVGIKRDTLDKRILLRGWSIKEALEIPVHLNNRILRKQFDGHTSADVLERLKNL